MRRTLTLHPGFRCAAVSGVEVEVARPGPGLLALRYTVRGRIEEVSLPPLSAPERADGLWRRTCFEAFVRPADGESYYEFNLAPSTQWAAYRFDRYRQGMEPADGGVAAMKVRAAEETFELDATLDLGALARGDGAWRLALTAVIEEAGGGISYWALAHPPGKADFHHPDGFVLDLPGSGRR